jgi:hypothetical protein
MPSLPVYTAPAGDITYPVTPEEKQASINLNARMAMRARLAPTREDVAPSAEVIRICKMPLVGPITDEEFEAYCRDNILAEAYEKGFRFFRTQAEATLAYEIYGGLFAPIGVGWGKTLISLMIAQRAFLQGKRKTLLLLPASVYSQLVTSNIPWARMRVPLNVPLHLMGGLSMGSRRALTRSKKVGCYVMPYSQLSTKDTRTQDNEMGLIEAIDPELIIGDEIHYLANRDSARSKRMINWMIEKKLKLACMSGTITNKSVKDYHHLAKLALGNNCFLPLSPQLASEWAQVLDANSFYTDGQTGSIKPLVDWGRINHPTEDFPFDKSGFRKAYMLRMTSTPGVVCTGDLEIKTSLTICNRPIHGKEKYAGWEKLEELVSDVNDKWLTPNGDEIEHAIHTHKWLRELSAGFYNEYVWPTNEMVQKSHAVTEEEAGELLTNSLDHHDKKQAYSKLLRTWIRDRGVPGLDTPMGVGSNMTHHKDRDVGNVLYKSWLEMKGSDSEELPVRLKRAVRVCDYKVSNAIRWAQSLKKDEGAVIWYAHKEMGLWAAELAEAAGLNFLHCPAGKKANDALELETRPENAKKILICSLKAHYIGKNLQPIGETYFLEWMQSAEVAEQSIGRNHRNGQMRDELNPVTCITTDFDEMAMASTLNDALYIAQTTSDRQKLVYCGFDPLPQVFPPELLRERGFQSKLLNEDQKQALEEKFGKYGAKG